MVTYIEKIKLEKMSKANIFVSYGNRPIEASIARYILCYSPLFYLAQPNHMQTSDIIRSGRRMKLSVIAVSVAIIKTRTI